jgi:predicted RNA-binding Zn-ribbon protein involved in translation (DUF1610 family)
MTPDGLRPIRCASCDKLICEADGTVVFRCPRCKLWTDSRPDPLSAERLPTG